MYFISQIGEQDCAFACLKMMLANYNKDRNYLYLTSNKEEAYSFLDLIPLAKEHQMTLRGIKISQPEELYKCDQFPIIVNLQRKKNLRHSVLLLKANPRYVIIFDPALGKRKMNTELFFKEWTGRALIVYEFTKTKCKDIYPDFIAKKDKLILPIFQVLSGVSLLLGTYFIGHTIIYLPIIFFSLFLLFEIIFRWSLVEAMKRMDEIIFSYPFKVKDKKYDELFQTIEKYRSLSLTILPNFIYALLITLFVSIVLIMNDIINAVYVFLPLALAAFEVFFYNPSFKNKETEVVDKEKEILEAENDQQFKLMVTNARSLSYKLGLSKNLLTYLEVGILLITIVLTMIFTSALNITYVVFYLCISVFLKTQFAKVIEYSSHDEEFDNARVKLINSLDFSEKN